MEIDLNSMMNEIKRQQVIVYESSGYELIYNYYKLVELIEFYDMLKPLHIIASESMIGEKLSYISNNQNNLYAKSSLELFQSMNFYKEYSKKLMYLNQPKNSYYSLEKMEINEIINLIYEFLNNFDKELLDYFKEMLNRKRVSIGNVRYSTHYIGLTTLYSKDPYIICDGNIKNLSLARVIVHELGHVLNRTVNSHLELEKNLEVSQSLLEEVSPMCLECMFIEYLINNNLFKKQAILLKEDNISELKAFSKQLFLISNIERLKYDRYFNITSSIKQIKKGIDSTKVSYSEYSGECLKNLNIKEIVKYFCGYSYAFENLDTISKEVLNEFIKNINNIEINEFNHSLKKHRGSSKL